MSDEAGSREEDDSVNVWWRAIKEKRGWGEQVDSYFYLYTK